MNKVITAGLGGLVALTLATPPASAVGTDSAGVSIAPRAQTQAAGYWTAERMRSARPADELLARTVHVVTGLVERGVTQVVGGRTASGGLLGGLLGSLLGGGGGGGGGGSAGSLYAGGGTVVRTTGRLFFTDDGIDYACSGSSVRARNESLVQTAGHCVSAGAGHYVHNVVFVPGYRDGSAPYGRFAAKRVATTPQWLKRGDLSFDVGYVVVGKVKNNSLADTVGAQGIGFNLGHGAVADVFGYPAEGRYNGKRLATCRGTRHADQRGTADEGVRCNLTGGASGGPWLRNFNAAKGVGVISSVTSFRYYGLLGSDPDLYGPYFGAAAQSLYATIQR